MTSINPIDPQQVNFFTSKKAQDEKVEDKKVAEETTNQTPTKDMTGETLDYMTNMGNIAMASVHRANRTIDVNKYVSPESKARIGEMMKSFEDGVIAGLGKFEEEMNGVSAFENLSDSDKLALSAELYASDSI